MTHRKILLPLVFIFSGFLLAALFWFVRETSAAITTDNFRSPNNMLTITAVQPNTAPNDIDTHIVVQGMDFTATISGTQLLTVPQVYLGDLELPEVIWGNTTTLSVTIPWGVAPEVYSLTVVNPDGISVTLQNAFTATQGFGVWSTDGPYGGTVPQVLINPHNSEIVYAVADGVALFASYNRGDTWEPILEGKTYDFSIAVDAVDPQEIWAGGGGYVYHTQDGGSTWDEVIGRGHNLHHCYVHRIVTHPIASGTILDAVSACSGWTPPIDRSGIYRSTDHGSTWITLTVDLTDTNFTALAIQPQNPVILLGGTEDGNLFLSQNGGQSWNWVEKLNGKIHKLDFNPFVTGEAWTSARSMISNPPPDLYKSTNLTDWYSVTVDTSLTWGQNYWSLKFLNGKIWAASNGVYTSTDGGANWNPVDGAGGGALSIDISSVDSNLLYLGTFREGLFRSQNGGASWQVANEGLAGLNPNAIAVDPNDPDIVYANTEIGLLKSNNGGDNWRELELFTGGYPAPNQLATDPFKADQVYFGQCGDSNVQGEFYSCYSDDGGDTWEYVTVTLPASMTTWTGIMTVVEPHPMIPGLIFGAATSNPPNSNNERGLIFVSDDYGSNWEQLSPTTAISEINQIAVDAVNPDLVYVATRGSGLWKSTDRGATWASTPLTPTTGVSYVVAHPSIENQVYFQVSTTDGGLNFLSKDAGETWQRIDTSIELGFGAPLLFTPEQPPLLYAACYFSERLCRSWDAGITWNYVPVIPYPQSLAAGTDGERIVIYVGTPGGVATGSGTQSAIITAYEGESTILGGGVYRLTTLLPDQWIYLPLILR